MPTTLTYPALIQQPFAGTPAGPNFGGKNIIPVGSASPLASFADGFPAVNMLPISGGGVPPAGKDFNGIFFYITAFQAWVNGGGRFKYDSTLSTAVGGYPAGAVLMLNDNASEVICVTAGTTNDPNSNMTGWAPFSGALSAAGFYQLDTGAVNAYVIARTPPITAYANGMGISFKAIHTNTGASTINAGPSAVPLHRNDGAALSAGDIISGSIYSAIYDSSTNSFCLVNAITSQANGAVAYGSFDTVQQSGFVSTGTIATYSNFIGYYFHQTDAFTLTCIKGCTLEIDIDVFMSGNMGGTDGSVYTHTCVATRNGVSVLTTIAKSYDLAAANGLVYGSRAGKALVTFAAGDTLKFSATLASNDGSGTDMAVVFRVLPGTILPPFVP